MKVPAVLTSGDHKKIDEWRREAAMELTRRNRPDLLPAEDAETKDTPQKSPKN